MKKTAKSLMFMAVAMLFGGQAYAQVRETTHYDDGSYYSGMRDSKGKRHGKGLMVFANGDRYDGDWNKGIIDGHGTYTYANGLVYDGSWKNGEIKGHGTFRFANGNVMEGDWTDMGTGKGYLQGTQHVLGYLPKTVAPTDFIFSVIAEETGFLGAAGLLGIMTCLLLCYCRTALLAGRPLGTFIAMGCAVIMATHAVINVGMTVQAAPIIGIPLPFVSYGGSFMLGTMVLAGLVQNVHIHRPRPGQQDDDEGMGE